MNILGVLRSYSRSLLTLSTMLCLGSGCLGAELSYNVVQTDARHVHLSFQIDNAVSMERATEALRSHAEEELSCQSNEQIAVTSMERVVHERRTEDGKKATTEISADAACQAPQRPVLQSEGIDS